MTAGSILGEPDRLAWVERHPQRPYDAMTASRAFDPERPLANRSIRYWPWPLGATKNAPLAERAEASAEGR